MKHLYSASAFQPPMFFLPYGTARSQRTHRVRSDLCISGTPLDFGCARSAKDARVQIMLLWTPRYT